MSLTTEDGFLQAIAESGTDNSTRLIFSDWLEENGDTPRAKFIRIQCDLADPTTSEKQRKTLQTQERELLCKHRKKWCQAVGLPIEDVRYQRGVIDGVYIPAFTGKKTGKKTINSVPLSHLVTVTELDLSGHQLGDEGLKEFAEKARFPALEKLVLCGNNITDAGAAALAKATGFPKLKTLYLFDNKVKSAGRKSLEKSKQFTLTNLDLGERETGYSMSAGEAEMGRKQYLRNHLLPVAEKYFKTYKALKSAMLCVAQFWDDEAYDAVHGNLIVSELHEPTLVGIKRFTKKAVNDPNLPTTTIQTKVKSFKEVGSVVHLWQYEWGENSDAIPLWAAFSPEKGSQESDFMNESYSPAVLIYPHGGYEFQPMIRPQLNGIQSEWEANGEDGEDDEDDVFNQY